MWFLLSFDSPRVRIPALTYMHAHTQARLLGCHTAQTQHIHTYIHTRMHTHRLGYWAAKQRRLYQAGKLPPERAQRLAAIGFSLSLPEQSKRASRKFFGQMRQIGHGHPGQIRQIGWTPPSETPPLMLPYHHQTTADAYSGEQHAYSAEQHAYSAPRNTHSSASVEHSAGTTYSAGEEGDSDGWGDTYSAGEGRYSADRTNSGDLTENTDMDGDLNMLKYHGAPVHADMNRVRARDNRHRDAVINAKEPESARVRENGIGRNHALVDGRGDARRMRVIKAPKLRYVRVLCACVCVCMMCRSSVSSET
jgi:hypothetical protein